MDNKQRQQLLTIAAVVCIGLFAGDKLIFSPLLSFWESRAERIAELDKFLMKGALLLERENDLKSRWETMQKEALPQDKSLAENEVVNASDRWENASHLTRVSFRPQWKQDQEDYMTVECHAVAQGDLASICRYLYELETDKLALFLGNIEITANDDKGEILTLQVQFSGLRLLEGKK